MPNDFNTPVQRELDWNDTIENEDRPFVILPEGNYPFRVISIEKARHTPGPQGKLPPCNKAVLTVRLTAPDGATADVKHHLSCTPARSGSCANSSPPSARAGRASPCG